MLKYINDNFYNYYIFSDKISHQVTKTIGLLCTDMIMYMSPGDMVNATCGCRASGSLSERF